MLRLLWRLLRTRRLLGVSMLWLLPQGLVGDWKLCKMEMLPVFSFSEIIHELPGYAVYECKKGFTRFPSKSNVIHCINGNWIPLEDPCGKVCPFPPKQIRAKLKDNFGMSTLFPVGMVVHYVCKKGFEQIPGILNTITCGENQKWSTLAKFCKGKACESPTQIKDGSIFSFNPEYIAGARITYMCFQGFTMIGQRRNICQEYGNNVHWRYPPPRCVRAICAIPPQVPGGSHNGTAPPYAVGTVLKYSCKETLSLIGEAIIYCSADKNNRPLWSSKPPRCQVIICAHPVVQDGVRKLSGFKDYYTFGSNITFECKIGYFMIGSHVIRCEANDTWIPKAPSCKKISRDTCGAPAITKGSVYPLQPQYEVGSIISVKCDKEYSFPDETIEMNTQCKGYNLWDPPIQLCFFRIFPDITQLRIRNGKIIHGGKEYYRPGDEIVVRCYAGYSLKGSSKVKYIGGKKWLPGVPCCNLRCLLPALIVGTKLVYKKLKKRLGTERKEMQQSTTPAKHFSFLLKNKVAVASPRELRNDLPSDTPKKSTLKGKFDNRRMRSKSLY